VLREVFAHAARFAADPPGMAARMREALAEPTALRDAGRALAASYGWPAAARAHLALYRELVG